MPKQRKQKLYWSGFVLWIKCQHKTRRLINDQKISVLMDWFWPEDKKVSFSKKNKAAVWKETSHAGIKSKLKENVSYFGDLFLSKLIKKWGSKNNEISSYSQVYRDQISHTCLVNFALWKVTFLEERQWVLCWLDDQWYQTICSFWYQSAAFISIIEYDEGKWQLLFRTWNKWKGKLTGMSRKRTKFLYLSEFFDNRVINIWM